MESQRFDNLSRMMASGVSRRTVLRGVVGGALAGIGLRAGVAAKADKVDICHYDADTGTYKKINVSMNAVDAHLAHGDRTADSCEGNFELDLDSCECVCALSACDAGFELDESACQCVQVAPTDVCAAEGSVIGTQCDPANGQKECAWSLDEQTLVCVNVFAGSSSEPPFDICEHSSDCPECGELCVNDRFGDGHCHPIDTGPCTN